MTPEQFCYWLQGYADGFGGLDEEVQKKLRSVLERKTLEQTREVVLGRYSKAVPGPKSVCWDDVEAYEKGNKT